MLVTALYNLPNTINASSTDAFETNFRQRWDIKAFDEGTQCVEMLQPFSLTHLIFPGEAIVRYLCQLYVAHLPARGLQELSEALRDMVEFYKEPLTQEQAVSLRATGIKAKITAAVVRPDFSVDYDEE